MIKCSLTEFGQAERESTRLWVMTYAPLCARPDPLSWLRAKYFPLRPSSWSIGTIFWPLNRYPHLCFEYLLFKGLGNLVWRLFRDLDVAKVVLVFRIVSDDEILHKHYYYVWHFKFYVFWHNFPKLLCNNDFRHLKEPSWALKLN